MKTPSCSHSQRHGFFGAIETSFLTFSLLKSNFFRKVITYSDSAWNSLSSYIFVYFLVLIDWQNNLSTMNTSPIDKRQQSFLSTFFPKYSDHEKQIFEEGIIDPERAWNSLSNHIFWSCLPLTCPMYWKIIPVLLR